MWQTALVAEKFVLLYEYGLLHNPAELRGTY